MSIPKKGIREPGTAPRVGRDRLQFRGLGAKLEFMGDLNRRGFLQSGLGMAVGAGSLGFPGALPRVSADEMRPEAGFVSFRPEIEPLVTAGKLLLAGGS